ncbi:hypothetical protein CA951_37675 [Rhodococcus sp. NCIMB 12038]|nr:hypothetical protein CA951_37675 [Rhodococcus sp. NCIMB 12038]
MQVLWQLVGGELSVNDLAERVGMPAPSGRPVAEIPSTPERSTRSRFQVSGGISSPPTRHPTPQDPSCSNLPGRPHPEGRRRCARDRRVLHHRRRHAYPRRAGERRRNLRCGQHTPRLPETPACPGKVRSRHPR